MDDPAPVAPQSGSEIPFFGVMALDNLSPTAIARQRWLSWAAQLVICNAAGAATSACGNSGSSADSGGGQSSQNGGASVVSRGGTTHRGGASAFGGSQVGGRTGAGGAVAASGGTTNVGAGGTTSPLSASVGGAAGSTVVIGGTSAGGAVSGASGAHTGGAGGHVGGGSTTSNTRSSTAGAGVGATAGQGNCAAPVVEPPVSGCGIYGTVTLEYRVEEANARIAFGVRLRNAWKPPVSIDQIEVHYYLSNEEASGWTAQVDSFVQRNPDVDLISTGEISITPLQPTLKEPLGTQTHLVRIRNHSSRALLNAASNGEPYLEFHVTLSPIDAAAPNQSHQNDYSYDSTMTEFGANSKMTVFVCGQMVVGCSPGSKGVGS